MNNKIFKYKKLTEVKKMSDSVINQTHQVTIRQTFPKDQKGFNNIPKRLYFNYFGHAINQQAASVAILAETEEDFLYFLTPQDLQIRTLYRMMYVINKNQIRVGNDNAYNTFNAIPETVLKIRQVSENSVSFYMPIMSQITGITNADPVWIPNENPTCNTNARWSGTFEDFTFDFIPDTYGIAFWCKELQEKNLEPNEGGEWIPKDCKAFIIPYIVAFKGERREGIPVKKMILQDTGQGYCKGDTGVLEREVTVDTWTGTETYKSRPFFSISQDEFDYVTDKKRISSLSETDYELILGWETDE